MNSVDIATKTLNIQLFIVTGYLVHMLEAKEQVKAFRRAFRIILSISNRKLIRKAVLSLKLLDLNRSRFCIHQAMDDNIKTR